MPVSRAAEARAEIAQYVFENRRAIGQRRVEEVGHGLPGTIAYLAILLAVFFCVHASVLSLDWFNSGRLVAGRVEHRPVEPRLARQGRNLIVLVGDLGLILVDLVQDLGAGLDVQLMLTSEWSGWSTGATLRNNKFYVDGTARYGHGAKRLDDGTYTMEAGAYSSAGKAEIKDGAVQFVSTSGTGGLGVGERSGTAVVKDRTTTWGLEGSGRGSVAGPFNFNFNKTK